MSKSRLFFPFPLLACCSLVVALGLTCASAWALPPQETWVVTHSPAASEIDQWNALSGTRDFLFELNDPQSSDLLSIGALTNVGKVTVVVSDFPYPDTTEAWKTLATRGVELVALDVTLPTDEEVDRLNQIGFKHCVFVLSYYPDPADAARMAGLKCGLDIKFLGKAYPKYSELAGVTAFPNDTTLTFDIDFWPYYIQMDELNLLARPIHLWIRGMYPPQDSLPYLANIKKLESITIENDTDPNTPQEWSEFGTVPVRWQSKDFLPSAENLEAFRLGGPNREFILDRDQDFTQDEREMLSKSLLPIRWIHGT
jgi:hypothetical protein